LDEGEEGEKLLGSFEGSGTKGGVGSGEERGDVHGRVGRGSLMRSWDLG